MTHAIAIVGMACRYPDARSPDELWENALAQRRAFRRIPAERLNLDDYLSSDRESPDRTYSTEGAFIEGYEFDRARFRVPGATYRAADPAAPHPGAARRPCVPRRRRSPAPHARPRAGGGVSTTEQ